ncbi:hypothetical protein GNZ01_07560 [Escherichia coli]|uniref:Uncharacterized protein n=1 Tax=Escherichia coli TaxID=562 RepID=A0AAJ3CXJ3_ECOLX|nr:hypothetical protein [Escherichia coli]EGE5867869.1 hypothetical protein [Escherichia coli]MUM71755.1 hypothetical protein [Escherichia coli]MUM83109.1 hypothetical protein [Escherichia coli]HAN4490970.1 hypothetical protein [Escherichia coli]
MAIITKIKVNNSLVKLEQVKAGYKVSWCGMYRMFADIDDAIKYYTDTVANFVRADVVMAVAQHKASKQSK